MKKRRVRRDVDLLRVPHAQLTHCYALGGSRRIIHKPHCTLGHPKCKWRRKDAGQVVCDCPSYGFPHRQGSGLCGQQIYDQWRRTGDPDRAYSTLTSRGKRERFSTLRRATEHAHMIANHERVHVSVLLGSRVISRVRPGAARDVKASPARRAENRTIDIFSGKTKLEESSKSARADWKGEAQKLARELAECRRTGRDPARVQDKIARFKAWHKKMMAGKRQDLADMGHNVGTVGKAAAKGRLPAISEMRPVRTPIGGFKLGRDPMKTKTKSLGRSRLRATRAHPRSRSATVMRASRAKTYDVWFLSSRKHTRYVVWYHGKNLSRVRAMAVARMLRERSQHKAIVLPHGEAPPEHKATPDYRFRIGQHVRAKSYGPGVVESRQRNFDWTGADDLYRVRVGQTLHLLGESQISAIASRRKITSRLARDPILLTPGQKRSLRSLVSGFGPLSYAERAAARNFHAMGLLKTNSIVDPSYVTLSSAGEKALAS
jgi:hypothetical protein